MQTGYLPETPASLPASNTCFCVFHYYLYIDIKYLFEDPTVTSEHRIKEAYSPYNNVFSFHNIAFGLKIDVMLIQRLVCFVFNLHDETYETNQFCQ